MSNVTFRPAPPDTRPRGWAGVTTALALGAALAGACKDDGGGPVSKEDAPDRAAEVMCALYFDCNCADHQDPDRFTSREHCEAEWKAKVQMDIDEADAAGLTYDPDCAGALLAAFEDLGCETNLAAALLQLAEDTGCKVFYGDKTGGQSCTDYGALGGDDCAQGLACDGPGTCVPVEPPPGPGDPCPSEFAPCTGDAVCIDLGDGLSCHTFPGTGEPCLGAPDFCAEGLSCDQASKTCGPAPGEGEPCAMAFLSQNQCAAGLACEAGTCVRPPAGGEPCTTVCADGFSCQAGTCAADTPVACLYAWNL